MVPTRWTYTRFNSWTMLYGESAHFSSSNPCPYNVTDTIYACQDIQDDIKMGVKSTAILFGPWIFPSLIVIATCLLILLAIAGVLNNQGLPFFIISVGGTTIHVVWQFSSVNLNDPESCGRKYQNILRLPEIIHESLRRHFQPKWISRVATLGRFDARLRTCLPLDETNAENLLSPSLYFVHRSMITA